MSQSIQLPWPPTINTYYRSVVIQKRPRVLISQKGRDYRKTVADEIVAQRVRQHGDGRLRVIIKAYPPDKRKRDLDNILKALLDSLEKAGVYDNDSQIDDLQVIRKPSKKPGHLDILIEVIEVIK